MLLTKHKEESFANIARGWAMLAPGGRLVCAGSNDDGAASLENHAGKALGLDDSLSKFHCRVFWLTRGERDRPTTGNTSQSCGPWPKADGSASPASSSWDRDRRRLGFSSPRHLPDDFLGTVADFGCGWGYLSREVLAHCPGVKHLDLIDAEHRALEAARPNIADARASFHWLDLTPNRRPRLRRRRLQSALPCRPRRRPALGQAFIEAAARP